MIPNICRIIILLLFDNFDNVDKFNIIADFMKKYYNCVILITQKNN